MVNEFHQAYCQYDRGVKVDAKALKLKLILIREDLSEIEIAQSFQYSHIIDPSSIKAMLVKNIILSELDETFEIEINTDPGTL